MLQIYQNDAEADEKQSRRSPPGAVGRGRLGQVAVVLAALVSLALLVGLPFGSARKPRLDTVKPTVGPAVLAIYGTGEVEPVSWAKLSTAANARLMQLYVAEGDRVRAGQVLARQDATVEEATLAELEARRKFYEDDYERKEKLAGRDIVSQQTLAQTRAFAEEYAAKVRAQRERIGLLSLISPIDGVVLRRDGELGELLAAGTTVLWVGDPGQLQVVAAIDEEDVALIHTGQKVLVKSDALAGRAIEGRITSITPKGDPVAKTFRVKAALPQASGLMVGMSVEVNIVAREAKEALLLPLTAVLDGHVVKIVDGEPMRVPVTTGIRSGTDIEIVSGIGREDVVARSAASARPAGS